MSTEALVGIGTGICGALVAALGYVYKEFLAYRKSMDEQSEAVRVELKTQRDTAQCKWEECERGHNQTRVDLAELRGKVEARDEITSLIKDTLERLERKGTERGNDGATA